VVLVYAHVDGVNGPSYFRWRWYHTGNQLTTALLLFAAASPALVAQWMRKRRAALALVAVTPALLQFTAIELWPAPLHGMQRAAAIVGHPMITSYFTVAQKIGGTATWLRDFPQILHDAPMHAATKPPGPIAFFLAMGNASAAAYTMLAFGPIAVLATYFAVRAIAGETPALHAATMLALVPSMTAIYPQMDWLYAVFSISAVALWHLALESNDRRAAIAFGLVLFVMTLFTYSLLVLGATFVLMMIGKHDVERPLRIALGTAVGAYILFCAITGYDAYGTFQTALARQSEIMGRMNAEWTLTGHARNYPYTILGDLQDFAFGLGWIPIVIALWSAAARRRLWIFVATPVIVAVAGLLAAETARVWIFVMPLVILAAAIELATWTMRERVITYALMIASAIAVYANAAFLLI
ncbi:MAG TPA: hypothetical protein VLU46_15760, partial [Thermoanaerobaculia bacterium]|nr:hypothetical protein [Thermoanaerobaculia bacterium]